MTKIKKVGILSVAKLHGVIMAVIGLIMGLFYAIIGAILGAAMSKLSSSGASGVTTGLGIAGFGILGIIILPIIFGIMGFLSGAVGAWIYNLFAGWLGGIEVELEQ